MRAANARTDAMGLRYRADIDGLRAVSILAVVFYHFGVPYFGGGFVGVDVFFVISGYLITGIVLAEQARGAFSFARFYERRARRLLPTLTIVLATTLAAGFLMMTPQDLEALSKSAFYTVAFTANLYFDSQGGYFGPNLELAPLLHAWSLAVEEQFYIAWPLLLVLTVRYAPKRLLPVAIALLAASLYANLAFVDTKPSAVFYRPQTRAWELLTGCVLAIGVPRLRGPLAHLAGVVGLALILLAVFAYTRDTQYPGAAAIVPVLGAALVIWSGQSAPSLVGRLLGAPPLVFVGLVSYAWYLWHWPMVALFRYQFEREPAAGEIAMLTLASFVLAAACWKFIEAPIRHGRWWKVRPRTLVAAVASSACVAAVAGVGYATDGFIDRYPPIMRELAREPLSTRPQDRPCKVETIRADVGGGFCHLWDASGGAPGILLWGDSHARALSPVFRDMGESADISVAFAGAAACPPLIGVGRVRSLGARDRCQRANASVAKALGEKRYTDVVLVSRWSIYTFDRDSNRSVNYLHDDLSRASSESENHAVIERGLRRTIDAITASGARVWFVMEAPFVGYDTPNRLARLIARGEDPQTLYTQDVKRQRERTSFMRDLVPRLPVRVIDPAASLCDSNGCLSAADGKPLYFDDNHLSIYGAARIAPQLTELFSRNGAGIKASAAGPTTIP